MKLINYIINEINQLILNLFGLIYKYLPIETSEDKFQKHKRNLRAMNKVKFEFESEKECIKYFKNAINIFSEPKFLNQKNVTLKSIIDKTNNKINLDRTHNCLYFYFNHYYISGGYMFYLMNRLLNVKPNIYFKTNPLLGFVNLPRYIWYIYNLKKKVYSKEKTFKGTLHNFIPNIKVENKRYYTYWYLLKNLHQSLNLNRPLIAAITIAFEEIDYINNNTGIIIIDFCKNDTVEDVKRKFKENAYQIFASNLLIHLPTYKFNFELRDYVDCVVSSTYIKTDVNFKIGWDIVNDPVEEVYLGSISTIKSDGSFNLNTCISSKSKKFKYKLDCDAEFFK
jgi:hypothetical protein